MTVITIPNRPAGTDVRSIGALIANFDAILTGINGNLDTGNILNGSLLGSDLAAGTLTATQLAASVVDGYLKLATVANRKAGFGTAAPGAWGSVAQRDWTVAHGLGVNPVVAFGIEAPIATFSSGGTLLPVIVSLVSKDATNLTFRGRTADGAATNNANTVYWLAIG